MLARRRRDRWRIPSDVHYLANAWRRKLNIRLLVLWQDPRLPSGSHGQHADQTRTNNGHSTVQSRAMWKVSTRCGRYVRDAEGGYVTWKVRTRCTGCVCDDVSRRPSSHHPYRCQHHLIPQSSLHRCLSFFYVLMTFTISC